MTSLLEKGGGTFAGIKMLLCEGGSAEESRGGSHVCSHQG